MLGAYDEYNIYCFTDFNLYFERFIQILKEVKTRVIVKRFPNRERSNNIGKRKLKFS